MTNKTKRSSKPSGFREISAYRGAAMSIEDQISFRNLIKEKDVRYYQVGRLSSARYFYKYLDLDSALLSIDNGNLLFAEPSRWQDKYESRFYTADYRSQNVIEREDCPLLLATCMTIKRYNEAAWVLYTYSKKGLGATCVEFQINKHKFRLQLLKALEEHDRIYEGVVMYQSPFVIDNMHHKIVKGEKNPNYYDYISRKENVPYLTNYLNLMLMKRDAFKHEIETRFFVIKDQMSDETKAKKNEEGKLGQSKLHNIDWIEIIEKVYINAKANSYEYKLLSDTLKSALDKKYIGVTDLDKLAEKDRLWAEKLKPTPYFVYGEPASSRLVIE